MQNKNFLTKFEALPRDDYGFRVGLDRLLDLSPIAECDPLCTESFDPTSRITFKDGSAARLANPTQEAFPAFADLVD